MTDLLAHLLRPLAEGGHGHEPDGYMVCWYDWGDLHEEDHHPEAWWADAIEHTHGARQP